ncbi:hypothetical protein [Lentzea sp. NBRC 102530]|uniref:hypothetical protein n=1 Tax=Lentzea sp. NBRC 102530 TaxID=3032201 RepID=UPI0024A3C2A6|nr:hypothetical protein [Lentzea sp. NBRC 102530]GLY55341.1 hypothetical protein Lesp01_89960 [Lentzea sp. NBRC 102530]
MIDPDRDYLLSKVIDLTTTLNEYRHEIGKLSSQLVESERQRTSLVEANATALATAEGWKDAAENRRGAHEWALRRYDEITLALAVRWGNKKQTKFLRKLGHIDED